MNLSENFQSKSLDQQKAEMRQTIAQNLKEGKDVDIDLFIYRNITEKGVPIPAWLQANDNDD